MANSPSNLTPAARRRAFESSLDEVLNAPPPASPDAPANLTDPVESPPGPETTELAAQLDAVLETAPESNPQSDTPEDDPVVSVLGHQLDQLLAPECPEPLETLETSDAPEASESAEVAPGPEVAAAPAKTPAESTGPDEAITQIDALLSEQADQAVADAWETPADVAAADDLDSLPSPDTEPDSAALHETDPAFNPPGAPPDPAASAPADLSPHQATQTSHHHAGNSDAQTADSDPTGVADNAEPPAPRPKSKPKAGPVSAASLIGGFKSTAKTVADELDHDAAHPPATDTAPPRDPNLRAGRLGPLLEVLILILAVINKPMMMLSPELRTIIGYVALITMFNGLVLVLLALLR